MNRQIRMMERARADGAIIVVATIFMVVKCTPENGESKTKDKYEGKFSIHHANKSSRQTGDSC